MKRILYNSTITQGTGNQDYSGYTHFTGRTEVTVTEERNCFIVWLQSSDAPMKLLKWFQTYERDAALEWAVEYKVAESEKI